MERESSCPQTEARVETEPAGDEPQPQEQAPARDLYSLGIIYPQYHGDGAPWRAGR